MGNWIIAVYLIIGLVLCKVETKLVLLGNYLDVNRMDKGLKVFMIFLWPIALVLLIFSIITIAIILILDLTLSYFTE